MKVQYRYVVLSHIDPNDGIENCGRRVSDNGTYVMCAFLTGGSERAIPSENG